MLAFSGDEVVRYLDLETFSLVVVASDFFEGARRLVTSPKRGVPRAPVIVLGELSPTRATEVDLVAGDDWDVPLVAAQGAALIALDRPVYLPKPLTWGPLELDVMTHEARWRGRPLPLTTLQFRVMEVLILAAGSLVTTEELARRVWGDGSFGDKERLIAHVRRIRKLIEQDPSVPRFLLRVRGKGFRLAGLGHGEDEVGPMAEAPPRS